MYAILPAIINAPIVRPVTAGGVKYRFDESSGVWNYTAHIPDDLGNADNWDKVSSEPGEKLTDFLERAGGPYQLKLGV